MFNCCLVAFAAVVPKIGPLYCVVQWGVGFVLQQLLLFSIVNSNLNVNRTRAPSPGVSASLSIWASTMRKSFNTFFFVFFLG